MKPRKTEYIDKSGAKIVYRSKSEAMLALYFDLIGIDDWQYEFIPKSDEFKNVGWIPDFTIIESTSFISRKSKLLNPSLSKYKLFENLLFIEYKPTMVNETYLIELINKFKEFLLCSKKYRNDPPRHHTTSCMLLIGGFYQPEKRQSCEFMLDNNDELIIVDDAYGYWSAWSYDESIYKNNDYESGLGRIALIEDILNYRFDLKNPENREVVLEIENGVKRVVKRNA